ncbi:hypothetical protein F441_11379 [Phytophthora nicotianae CJ01A1]|uniref:DDE-1 domain-containing protein n=1 Tax=Phytophthora nicotianae CJ01A1 TaxID=1317063 RepID=W2WSE5_PHYNI|nr:hypothetical protein F441_11379 [Phytophthora nicotianae CJ01A1]
MYVRNPNPPKKLLDWIVEMRKNRYLCVSMACMLIMLPRYDPERAKYRTRLGNLAFLKRFLKRNRLTVRRITQKGRKKRSDMEPSVDGCRLLILDSLKVNRMASLRAVLGKCCTQLQFVSSGITGLGQPMDVAVMKPFKDAFPGGDIIK